MNTSVDKLRADFKKLSAQGVNLFNAMHVEQYPERTETHVTNILKKDYEAFKKSLPAFGSAYQAWYSEAQSLVKIFLPDRLSDFTNLYETPKGRKEIKPDNYVIEDYLKDVTITAGFDKKIVASPADAIPVFQQQLNILNSINARFESTLFDFKQLLQADLFDAELLSAKELAKNQFFRSAGAICGVILEKHLDQIRQSHNIKLNKKSPSIADYNDLLKKNDIYDFQQWRLIQYLGQIRDLCSRNKKTAPGAEDISDMIDGVEKVIKTIF
jgi:hypothetical protein